MSDTFKEFLKKLDLPEELAEKTVDEIHESFQSNFIHKTIAETDPDLTSKIVGKRMGGLQTLAVREFGLDSAEVKDKKIEEILSLAASKNKAALEEATRLAGGGDSEWQTKYEALNNEYGQIKTMAEKLKEEKDLEIAKKEGEMKGLRLNYSLASVKSSLPYSEDFDDLKKKGLEAHMSEKYKFDFDDEGKVVVTDKAGAKIPNANKTGFLSVEEVFKTELKAFNGLKLADSKKPSTKEPVKFQNGNERKLPANLAKALGR